MDLAEAIGPNCKKNVIGIRPGEKIHEEMITPSDSFSTIDLGDYYAVLTADGEIKKMYDECDINYSNVPQGFSYNSGNNSNFLTVEEIRELIKMHIDPNFSPV